MLPVMSDHDRKTFGLHIPKITVPRDSIAVRRDAANAIEDELAPQSNSGTVLAAITKPMKGGLPPISSEEDVNSGAMLNVKTVLSNLDPENDIYIAEVMSEIKTRKSFFGPLPENGTGSVKSSLFEHILKAKEQEMSRIRKTIARNDTQAKRRWKSSTNAIVSTHITQIKKVARKANNEVDELADLSIDKYGSDQCVVTPKSDVESLELHDKKERTPNSRGLKSLAKMFNKDRDTVTDTPTIFALLRASHIVSVAVVTHQERQSHEKEMTAYEQTLRHYLAFLPDLCIVNTLRPRSKSLEEFEGVAMFADVSGFTVLCATYGTVNISKLKEILNLVMGNIVDEILMSGGDIISFAGDAIFAVWRTHSVEERSSILPKILKCSIHIQDAVNLAVDKSITLRVKVGLAVGKMFSFYLESSCRDHIAVVGPAVKDVNKAEGSCIAGNIVCSQQFFDEIPKKEGYPFMQSKPGYIQLWPPKNNAKSTVNDFLDSLGNGYHITLDRCKVVKKIADDLLKQDLLKRYIPDYLRFQLEEGQGTSWASQVRTITTLFISLVFADSKKVSVDHENVQDALICIDEIVDKMNGTVNKIFTFDKGCTILVAFGTQGFKMNDDPRRALKTAQMILPSLQNNVSDFQGVSIGVTTGLCFCGVVGHEDRHEYTVIGHQVNLACRLMSNYPFCVACDESTKKLSTLPDSAFTTLPPKVLKGVPPGGLYFNFHENTNEDMSMSDAWHKPRGSLGASADKIIRMVGRARELDALYACMATVESLEPGKAQNAIIIEAQAGFGKTRLLDQYILIGKHRNYNVIMVPLLMDEMTTPFFAVKMIMYKLLELYKPSNSKNKEGVIARYVPEYMRSDMCLLNDLLGTRFKRDSTRDFSFKNLHKLLKLIMKEIVRDHPHLFIIDNAEYLDQQSWEFMTDLSTLRKKTILIMSMRRTSHRYSRAEAQILTNPRTKKFVLDSFTPYEIEEFCKAVLNVKDVPAELVKVLSEKTRGIPQYCEGLLKKMLKEQVIRVVDDMDAYRNPVNTNRLRGARASRRFSIFNFNTKASPLALPRGSTVQEEDEVLKLNLPGSADDEPDLSLCCGGCFPENPQEEDIITSLERLDLTNEKSLKICVLNDSVNLSNVALPDSVKELFLAQFDRLLVTEQVTMKCCAVLGTYFSMSLLKSVLPHRTSTQINHSVRIMIREQMMECGGSIVLGNTCTNMYCSKRSKIKVNADGDNVPVCEVMRFSTQFSAEILRDLLLPEQRIRIHETAAHVLEKKIVSYDFCCKKEFFGSVYRISAMGETGRPNWSQKTGLSSVNGQSSSCQCHIMFTTIYPQIIRHFKEAGTNHSLFEALCSAGALGMALSFTFEAISYLEDALTLTKSRIKLNDRHRACLSSLLCLAMYLCPTPTTIRLYKEAIQLGGHAQVIYKYNVSCMSYLCGGRDRSRPDISY